MATIVEAANLAAAATAVALAFVVLRISARSPLHRALVLTLGLEAVLQGASGLPAEGPSRGALVREAVFLLALPALPAAYLLLGSFFDAPLGRWLARFRRALVAAAIVPSGLGATAFVFARPSTGAPWAIPLFVVVMAALAFASIASLVITIGAWRRAPAGSLQRRQAGAAALAFAARDVLVAGAALAGAGFAAFAPGFDGTVFLGIAFALALLLFTAFLTYGILKARVLDLDLRVRTGVARGTLAAVFIAGYVATSQLASLFVAPQLGTAVGLAVVLLLALAFVPLHRAADRLAVAVVPADRAPVTKRRIEAYRLAVREIGASPDAADLLAALRARLGLTERDAEIITFLAEDGDALPDAIAVGDVVLDRFAIEAELGAGSQGRTYLGRDVALDRKVVLKVVHRGRPVEEALDEGRALARIRHPRVVAVHDVRATGERIAIVLEHVEGEPLAQRLRRGPLDRHALRALAHDLLDALAAVHDAGLVHGDVKPANVLIEPDGRAKLADFGIATLASASGGTQVGLRAAVVRGTPGYASPEQLAGRPASARSDLYSLARTLAEAAGGEIPREIASALERALREDPDARYPDARAMREAVAPTPAPDHDS